MYGWHKMGLPQNNNFNYIIGLSLLFQCKNKEEIGAIMSAPTLIKGEIGGITSKAIMGEILISLSTTKISQGTKKQKLSQNMAHKDKSYRAK